MPDKQQNQEITLSELQLKKALDKGFFMGAIRGAMLGVVLGFSLTIVAVTFAETKLHIGPNTLFGKDKIAPIELIVLAVALLLCLKYRKSKQVVPILRKD